MDKRMVAALAMGLAPLNLRDISKEIVDLKKPTIERIPASTKLGRQIAAHNSAKIEHTNLTQDQKDWNAQIEAKRLEKQLRKKHRG